MTTGKSGKENAGEKCGTTGNKREYKMRDLIATRDCNPGTIFQSRDFGIEKRQSRD